MVHVVCQVELTRSLIGDCDERFIVLLVAAVKASNITACLMPLLLIVSGCICITVTY